MCKPFHTLIKVVASTQREFLGFQAPEASVKEMQELKKLLPEREKCKARRDRGAHPSENPEQLCWYLLSCGDFRTPPWL